MVQVLFIFKLLTVPLSNFPLMLTFPVKGHFLSMYVPSMASRGVLIPRPTFLVHLPSLLDLGTLVPI